MNYLPHTRLIYDPPYARENKLEYNWIECLRLDTEWNRVTFQPNIRAYRVWMFIDIHISDT